MVGCSKDDGVATTLKTFSKLETSAPPTYTDTELLGKTGQTLYICKLYNYWSNEIIQEEEEEEKHCAGYKSSAFCREEK